MKGFAWIAIWLMVFLGIAFYGSKQKQTRKVYPYPQQPQQPYWPESPAPPIQPAPEPPVPTPIPEFTICPKIQNVTNLGTVLSDIESHMPAGHIYRDSDKITWGHETSHGIHSRVRNKYQRHNQGRINAFYVLEDRAVIVQEPKTTISTAARLVPRSLRGGVYNLYMVSQARSWNDTPLYVFDEWVAYGNGALVRADLNIQNRDETVTYMLEFNNYAIAVAMAARTNDEQFKRFLMWNLERSMQIYEDNRSIGDTSRATSYLEVTRNSEDAEELREFARSYLGEKWTKRVLGY